MAILAQVIELATYSYLHKYNSIGTMKNATARLETDIGMVGIETGEREDGPASLHNAANMVAEHGSDLMDGPTIKHALVAVMEAVARIEARLEEIAAIPSMQSWRPTLLQPQPSKPKKEIRLAQESTTDADKAVENGAWLRSKVKSWRADKGYGFIVAGQAEVFAHVSVVDGGDASLVGAIVYCRIIADGPRGPGSFRAVAVRREMRHFETIAREQALQLAQASVEAAACAKEAAEAAEWDTTGRSGHDRLGLLTLGASRSNQVTIELLSQSLPCRTARCQRL